MAVKLTNLFGFLRRDEKPEKRKEAEVKVRSQEERPRRVVDIPVGFVGGDKNEREGVMMVD